MLRISLYFLTGFLFVTVTTSCVTAQSGVELRQTSNAIDVNINGNPFTSYIYQLDPAKPLAAEGVLLIKPVLYPLRTPSGIKVTRGWPFEKIEGESQDHPHHMGLYFTYDLPGNGFWNNSALPLPIIRHIKAQITNDPHGNPAIQSVMHWISKDNEESLKVENPNPFNLILKKGETAPFKFRVIIYDGSRTKQQIGKEYQEYAYKTN